MQVRVFILPDQVAPTLPGTEWPSGAPSVFKSARVRACACEWTGFMAHAVVYDVFLMINTQPVNNRERSASV